MDVLAPPQLAGHVIVVRRKDVDRGVAHLRVGMVQEKVRRDFHPRTENLPLLTVSCQNTVV